MADRAGRAAFRRSGRCPRLSAAGGGDGAAVGAVRRADPGGHPDRRGPAGRGRGDHHPVAGLCGRRRHVSGPGAAGRRAGVQGDEGGAGRRRMDQAGAGRSGPDRRRRHRPGFGHRTADPCVGGQHGPDRTDAAGHHRPRRAGEPGADRSGQSAGRGRHAAADGGGRLDQLPAPDDRAAARQGRGRGFLDLLLHQLLALHPLRPGVGREIQGSGSGRDRRPHARVRLREVRGQCPSGGRTSGRHLPCRHGQ